VEKGNPWTVPVEAETVAAARNARWSILLTPTKPVPLDWWPDLRGLRVLCLASGGGQQGPILAAAGADVTVLDNSPRQLAQDRLVAEREGLALTTVEGDMADLGMFPGSSFDVIVHPVSNVFVPDVHPVWREAFRVLRPGGLLLAGFVNPATFLFDFDEAKRSGEFVVRYTLPYSDLDQLGEQQKRRYSEQGDPLEFSHTLEDQIGGQLAAGFVLTGFYEDRDREEDDEELSRFMPVYIATRAVKP
jgi:SAM-dependent methyltransferase